MRQRHWATLSEPFVRSRGCWPTRSARAKSRAQTSEYYYKMRWGYNIVIIIIIEFERLYYKRNISTTPSHHILFTTRARVTTHVGRCENTLTDVCVCVCVFFVYVWLGRPWRTCRESRRRGRRDIFVNYKAVCRVLPRVNSVCATTESCIVHTRIIIGISGETRNFSWGGKGVEGPEKPRYKTINQ